MSNNDVFSAALLAHYVSVKSLNLAVNSTGLDTKISVYYTMYLGDRDSESLRAGRSGDRIPVGAGFSAHVQTGPGAHPASYTMGTGSFLEVMRPGPGVDHPSPSSAEVEG
jgi:hypothetical protein